MRFICFLIEQQVASLLLVNSLGVPSFHVFIIPDERLWLAMVSLTVLFACITNLLLIVCN